MNTRNALSNEVIAELSTLISKSKLSLLAGSGISVNSGLPTWDNFLQSFILFCEELSEFFSNELPDLLLDDSKKQLTKNPTKVASVLKQQLKKINNETVNEEFQKWFMQQFNSSNFNKNHEYIVGTNYPIIMTSNYDTLLEEAAKTLKFKKLVLNSVSFKSFDKLAKFIYENEDCIIHIHGKWQEIGFNNVVFTHDDYLTIMKQKPGFRMAIETIFIMNSILFVGYGMSDPHLEDLIEEVSQNMDFIKNEIKKFYVVTLEDKVTPVIKKFKESQGIELLTIKDHSELTLLLKTLQNKNPRN